MAAARARLRGSGRAERSWVDRKGRGGLRRDRQRFRRIGRVAVIGAGTLDSLPHNGAVVTLLALCGLTHRESYFDIVMVAIVGALIALVAVILLGSAVGSF